MKRSLKVLFAGALTMMMMLGLSSTAFAEQEQIKKVNLKLSGSAPQAGQRIDDDSFSASTNEGIIRYANWANFHGTWEKGDIPEIFVQIEVAAGYYGEDTKVKVSGMSATIEDCDIDEENISLMLRLPAVKGGSTSYELDPPEDLYWESSTKAQWDKVSDANRYEVKLYRNGNAVTTETTQSRSINFKSSMTKEGYYSFRVRAEHGSSKGEWSIDSEDRYVSESEAKSNAGNNNNPTPNPNPSPVKPVGPTFSSFWRTDAAGNWHVYDRYGNMITNCWLCDDAVVTNGQNIWYLIDGNGNMVSAGLVRDANGNYYSLETDHNGYYGMMRYVSGIYGALNLNLESQHNGRFGAILNQDAINILNSMYGTTDIGYISTRCVYTSQL